MRTKSALSAYIGVYVALILCAYRFASPRTKRKANDVRGPGEPETKKPRGRPPRGMQWNSHRGCWSPVSAAASQGGGNMAAGGVPVVGMHAAMPMGGYQPMPYAPINGGSNLAYNVGSWDKRPQSHLSHLFTAPDGTETYVAPGAMGMPVPWVAGGEPAPGSFAADGAAGYSGVWGGPAAAYGGGGYSGSYMPGYAPADNQDFANGIHYPNQPDDAQA